MFHYASPKLHEVPPTAVWRQHVCQPGLLAYPTPSSSQKHADKHVPPPRASSTVTEINAGAWRALETSPLIVEYCLPMVNEITYRAYLKLNWFCACVMLKIPVMPQVMTLPCESCAPKQRGNKKNLKFGRCFTPSWRIFHQGLKNGSQHHGGSKPVRGRVPPF